MLDDFLLGWLEGFEPSSSVPQTDALTTVL